MTYTPTPLIETWLALEMAQWAENEFSAIASEFAAVAGYVADALTGGAVGALDAIDGDLLSDGDSAIVIEGNNPARVRRYVLDADNAGAENSPRVIAPDTNPGDKRWVLAGTLPHVWIGGAEPAVTDDDSTGAAEGNLWLYDGRAWVCIDASTGAAVWLELLQIGTAAGTAADGAVVDGLSSDLSTLGGVVSGQGGDISTLQGQVTTLDGDLTTLGGTVSGIGGELTSHEGAGNPHSGSASTSDLSTHTGAANPHSGSASTSALSAHTEAAAPHSGHATLTAGVLSVDERPPVYMDLRISIDGGAAEIAVDTTVWTQVNFDCEIVGWTLLADQSGDIVIDLWADTYANYPPTVADTITASAKPAISGADKATDASLTGWTTSLSAGDVLKLNVDSCSTIQRVAMVLKVLVS